MPNYRLAALITLVQREARNVDIFGLTRQRASSRLLIFLHHKHSILRINMLNQSLAFHKLAQNLIDFIRLL